MIADMLTRAQTACDEKLEPDFPGRLPSAANLATSSPSSSSFFFFYSQRVGSGATSPAGNSGRHAPHTPSRKRAWDAHKAKVCAHVRTHRPHTCMHATVDESPLSPHASTHTQRQAGETLDNTPTHPPPRHTVVFHQPLHTQTSHLSSVQACVWAAGEEINSG